MRDPRQEIGILERRKLVIGDNVKRRAVLEELATVVL
jgi:hypothetical protein